MLLVTAMVGCRRLPTLYDHNHQPGHIMTQLPVVDLNLNIYWDYTMDLGWDYNWQYDWQAEWIYGWDETDVNLWGEIGYVEPTHFHLRRYYTRNQAYGPHTRTPLPEYISGRSYSAQYDFGYYDLLVWNDVHTLDGVQSLIFDEESTLDSVVAFTNPTRRIAQGLPGKVMYAHWQPEGLITDYAQAVYISPDIRDYKRYDPELDLYFMDINMTLRPVTYIYLVQLILHNNKGRINNVLGEADATGFAGSTCLNTGRAGSNVVAVYFETRMKNNVDNHGEIVDVAGGRFVTFGICNVAANAVTKRSAETRAGDRVITAKDVATADKEEHYVNIPLVFNNGHDSIISFPVTDKVRQLYRGGVLTLELDVDTVPIPGRSGGKLFDAVVVDPDSVTYEIPL